MPTPTPDQIRHFYSVRLGHIPSHWSAVVARCPLHPDTGWSLSVDLGTGTWRCKVCGSGGILEFEQRFAKCTARAAGDNLRTILGQGLSFSSEEHSNA